MSVSTMSALGACGWVCGNNRPAHVEATGVLAWVRMAFLGSDFLTTAGAAGLRAGGGASCAATILMMPSPYSTWSFLGGAAALTYQVLVLMRLCTQGLLGSMVQSHSECFNWARRHSSLHVRGTR